MGICIKTARIKDRAEELYQQFFLTLCEVTDDRLIKAFEGKYLEYFCYGIICRIWGKRDRVKRGEKGSTSNLYYLSDTTINMDYIEFDDEGDAVKEIEDLTDYNFTNIDKNEKALKQINEDMNSADRVIHFRANIFYYSHIKYKSMSSFHRVSGIPYHIIQESRKMYEERLKKLCN